MCRLLPPACFAARGRFGAGGACVSWCWLELTHAVLRLCWLLLSEPVVCREGVGPPVSHARLVGVLAPQTSRCIEEVVQECAAMRTWL